MKKFYKSLTQTTRLLLIVVILFYAMSAAGQTTYNITSNKNWSAILPTTCAACTITISSGVTLTIDKDVTCQNCSIQGGNISMTNHTMNIQYFGGSPVTTTFQNTNFQIYGSGGKVIVNAPLSLTSSVFTFNNTSYFNTSYQVDLVSSTVNLYDSATMYSTGSSSTGINLSGNSKIKVGSGTKTSTATLTVSGPTLNVYDTSSVALGNVNNVYYNWSNYNAGATKAGGTNNSYSTNGSTLNCGGTGQHSCSSPSVYGPSALTTSGAVPGSTLPVVLTDFSAALNSDGNAHLSWETKQEQNSNRFEIERSASGTGWSPIGTVQAKGNSTLSSSYFFTDISPLAGTNYYRLKMIDLDGSAVYSEVKAIQSATASRISFFPNPARDVVNLTLGGMSTGAATVRIINQAGAVLQEKKAQGGTTVTFSLQQLSAGFYILSVTSADGVRESSKLLINRS